MLDLDHEFKLKPSKQYILLIGIIFLLSLAIFVCLPMTIFLKISGFLLLLLYGAYLLWNKGLLRGKQTITTLKCEGDRRWRVSMMNNQVEAELLGDSTVTGLVSILRFRIPHRLLPLSCVVFKDSLPRDRYRQLVVILKA